MFEIFKWLIKPQYTWIDLAIGCYAAVEIYRGHTWKGVALAVAAMILGAFLTKIRKAIE